MTKSLATKLINKIIEASGHFLVDEKQCADESLLNNFIKCFFNHIPFRRLHNLKKNFGYNALTSLLIQAWNLIRQVEDDKPHIDVFCFKKSSKINYTFITIINHDRPFLVDTVQLVCRKNDICISDIIHPVVPLSVVDDSKLEQEKDVSVISVIIEDVLTPAQTSDLLKSFEESFEDLYLATGQYSEILDLANEVSALSSEIQLSIDDLSTQDVVDFSKWLFHDRCTVFGARVFTKNTIKNFGIFKKSSYQNHYDFKLFYSNQIGKKPLKLYRLLKVSLRAIVHHHARIVVFEIPILNKQGLVEGCYQFIGIFNRLFYRESPPNVPILDKKIDRIYQKFHLKPEWHNAKEIQLILSSVPNDELLLLDDSVLYQLCSDLLFSEEHIALLMRHDLQSKTTTMQIFIPKDWYTYELPVKIMEYITKEYALTINNHTVQLGELPYARLIIIASTDKLSSPLKIEKLREPITKIVMNWEEQVSQLLEDENNFPNIKVSGVFPVSYQTNFAPQNAISDLYKLESLIKNKQTDFELFFKDDLLFIKAFQIEQSISLSAIMPILENFGLYVESESSYFVKYEGHSIWIHCIACKKPKNFENLAVLRQALLMVWFQQIENDSFNQFVVLSHLTAQQVNVLRALNKALQQFHFTYTPSYVVEVLATYSQITQHLWELFDEKFNPNCKEADCDKILKNLTTELQYVKQSDHDKIFNRFINCIQSIVRTNFYQASSGSYLSFKFDSRTLDDLPLPKPLFEIFVYSPYMEGCHLRGGKIARGGIRWSDRFEDFRNEVLGLMKAQMVKNSIIVPVGSKGGFICKNYHLLKKQNASKEDLQNEVVRCYKTLIKGMLDLTDNIVNQKVQKPLNTICYDDDDFYLVVAADKGTSTFSDIANKLASEHEFWLGDAFASGGSKGYDHKKMAITSRGAWISVCHHFKQLGTDPQLNSISVVGVGDMSGDVFGNGMLRSDAINLVAAFNHMHIFLDPSPDPKTSFNERLRLFNTAGSTWDDYDKSLISQGGGVYNRNDKTIEVSPQVRKILDLPETTKSLTPDKLIIAILKAPVNLMWFGGIGTYIKASSETHSDAYDRQNDRIRVNANELRCNVIGEGANLAMTQRARIEYALQGGHLNTDAIDNSAGVDCSDHEVNIKILFSELVQSKKLSLQQRDAYLEQMTDEVATLVLEDNEQQNEILTLLQRENLQAGASYLDLIHILENDSVMALDRAIEFIPDSQTLKQRSAEGKGLSRPELAILLSYSKNILSHQLVEGLSGNEFPELVLEYFPKILRDNFESSILNHPLKREILATRMANLMINKLGPTFVFEVAKILDINPYHVALNFFVIKKLLKTNNMWDGLKNNVYDLRYTMLVCSIALKNLEGFHNSEEAFLKAKCLSSYLTLEDLSPIILAALFKISELDININQKVAHNLIKVAYELGFNQISNALRNYHHFQESWQKEIFSNLQNKLIESLTNITFCVTKVGDFNLWRKNYAQQVSQINKSITYLEANPFDHGSIDLSYIMYVIGQIGDLLQGSGRRQ